MAASAGVARRLKLLLDGMHSPSIADVLCHDGHDVVAVTAMRTLRGTSDEDLLIYATGQGLVLVTQDIVDLAIISGHWLPAGRVHAGLVFTSPKRFNRSRIAHAGNLVVALRKLLSDPPDLGASGTWRL